MCIVRRAGAASESPVLRSWTRPVACVLLFATGGQRLCSKPGAVGGRRLLPSLCRGLGARLPRCCTCTGYRGGYPSRKWPRHAHQLRSWHGQGISAAEPSATTAPLAQVGQRPAPAQPRAVEGPHAPSSVAGSQPARGAPRFTGLGAARQCQTLQQGLWVWLEDVRLHPPRRGTIRGKLLQGVIRCERGCSKALLSSHPAEFGGTRQPESRQAPREARVLVPLGRRALRRNVVHLVRRTAARSRTHGRIRHQGIGLLPLRSSPQANASTLSHRRHRLGPAPWQGNASYRSGASRATR
mmetsp:Transcript_9955/g.38701  ORF Transcript_9955/g.38701 Transcript_9955/m.38701 type:complete len:297 (-) Transcript_9955:543-1433(-)